MDWLPLCHNYIKHSADWTNMFVPSLWSAVLSSLVVNHAWLIPSTLALWAVLTRGGSTEDVAATAEVPATLFLPTFIFCWKHSRTEMSNNHVQNCQTAIRVRWLCDTTKFKVCQVTMNLLIERIKVSLETTILLLLFHSRTTLAVLVGLHL